KATVIKIILKTARMNGLSTSHNHHVVIVYDMIAIDIPVTDVSGLDLGAKISVIWDIVFQDIHTIRGIIKIFILINTVIDEPVKHAGRITHPRHIQRRTGLPDGQVIEHEILVACKAKYFIPVETDVKVGLPSELR